MPLFLQWPAFTRGRSATVQTPVHLWDLLPTLVEAAGVPLDADTRGELDGVSLLPLAAAALAGACTHTIQPRRSLGCVSLSPTRPAPHQATSAARGRLADAGHYGGQCTGGAVVCSTRCAKACKAPGAGRQASRCCMNASASCRRVEAARGVRRHSKPVARARSRRRGVWLAATVSRARDPDPAPRPAAPSP